MSASYILTQKQGSNVSKLFMVSPGSAMVISSFNFRCAQVDDEGNVIDSADCAVLHKVELEGDPIPTIDGCIECERCILDNQSVNIVGSEPVMQCGKTWTHNAGNNLSVLSVPGFYMFELCNESAVGTATIKIEEITAEQAALIPKTLFHGD